MDNFYFVKQELRDIPKKNALFFVWLCTIRILPFLVTNNDLGYWKKSKRGEYLYAIFHIIDLVAAAATRDATNPFRYTNDVDDITDALIIAINDIFKGSVASMVAQAVTNVLYTVARGIAFASYASSTADSAFSDAIIHIANGSADVAKYALIDSDNNGYNFRELLFEDFYLVKNENFESFNHDLSMYESPEYGNIWGNFILSLKNTGCGYWADIYTDLFNSGLKIDQVELKSRLSVPGEIKIQGAAAVADYLDNASKQGLVYTQRETRLIILGSAGAGKTTLVRRLSGDNTYPAPKDSTHGVDTKVTLDFNGTKTHVWDFGGQVIYHASHRCFMSENCVYILVVNARTDDNHDINRIRYWLDTVRIYTDNRAKVFIVINESDNRKQNIEDYDSLKSGGYAFLIQGVYSFNIGEDIESINKFKSELSAYIENIGHQTFGKNDSLAMLKIRALFEQGEKIMEANALEDILINNNIQSKKDRRRAIKLFNTLGVALSYDFMEGYILNPYWISHGVYNIIDYMQRNKLKFITYEELDHVFQDERDIYPGEKSGYILDLMAYYKIGFRNKGGVRGIIIPCVTSQFRPKDLMVDVMPEDNLMIRVERDELQEFPADFFYKYICSNEDDIKKNGEIWAMWQMGIVLVGDHASALVELIENRRIEITVWGEGKEAYHKKLEMLINDLLHEYSFTSYEEHRQKGNKLIKVIVLVFESIAKGITKAVIEAASGGIVK